MICLQEITSALWLKHSKYMQMYPLLHLCFQLLLQLSQKKRPQLNMWDLEQILKACVGIEFETPWFAWIYQMHLEFECMYLSLLLWFDNLALYYQPLWYCIKSLYKLSVTSLGCDERNRYWYNCRTYVAFLFINWTFLITTCTTILKKKITALCSILPNFIIQLVVSIENVTFTAGSRYTISMVVSPIIGFCSFLSINTKIVLQY